MISKRLTEARDSYDVIIVGAGAGGGVAASVLTQAGLRVLVLDRGEVLGYEDIGNDHLRNYRLSRYGHNAPPYLDDGGVRVYVDADGVEHVVAPWEPGYGALPYVVGGGTRLYQGMAWRLTPEDFHLATTHGVPEGSSLADWPFEYDELEPYYTRVEQEIGVSGDGSAHRNQGARSAAYPMPPLPDNTEAQVLRRGAEKLGLATGPVPMLINSVPRAGRGQCVQCGECVGFACPSDAKNGPYNALLPAAIEAGCELVTGARVLEVTTDPTGRVTGVRAVDEHTGEQRSLRAGHVVVAAAAIETARLLLASRSERHPRGLGNHSDQLGRNLQGHIYVGGFGRFDEPVIDGPGPNVRIATCDYVNRIPGRHRDRRAGQRDRQTAYPALELGPAAGRARGGDSPASRRCATSTAGPVTSSVRCRRCPCRTCASPSTRTTPTATACRSRGSPDGSTPRRSAPPRRSGRRRWSGSSHPAPGRPGARARSGPAPRAASIRPGPPAWATTRPPR